MKKHTKIYLVSAGKTVADIIMCEYCNMELAVDVHHISPRGMGGDPSKDVAENLIALCRNCHTKIEGVKKYDKQLREIAKRRCDVNNRN
ncbi:hypothetical protein DRJ16_07080 [Candidatus Woesearchaeota archaeon]|nr:MAG: hypothetical protein DRJ16_07080 [Candidatus Woesearchaeota archaeon]